MGDWPCVQLVEIPVLLDGSVSQDVRAMADELSRHGVPSAILMVRYRASEAITYRCVEGKSLLLFGKALSWEIGLDVSTGAVVWVTSRVEVVNSSLQKFIETAKLVTARFPFYGENDPDEMSFEAAEDVATAIRSVETEGMAPDGFWSTLVDDIQMGDFVTEWLLDLGRGEIR